MPLHLLLVASIFSPTLTPYACLSLYLPSAIYRYRRWSITSTAVMAVALLAGHRFRYRRQKRIYDPPRCGLRDTVMPTLALFFKLTTEGEDGGRVYPCQRRRVLSSHRPRVEFLKFQHSLLAGLTSCGMPLVSCSKRHLGTSGNSTPCQLFLWRKRSKGLSSRKASCRHIHCMLISCT